MGYSTDFYGSVEFNKPVTTELRDYINRFSHIRHMTRDPEIIKQIDPDWEKHCYKGNLGPSGIFYLPPDEFPADVVKQRTPWDKPDANNMVKNYFGQTIDKSVIADTPAEDCPGYWCQWIIDDNGDLCWDGGEKFYSYQQWMEFLIKHFFAPEGYILNGSMDFQGEERDDRGQLIVIDNVVDIQYDEIY